MLRSFNLFISTMLLIPYTFRLLNRQKKFLKQNIYPLVDEYADFLDSEDIRKIKLYGTTIPALMGEAFCALRAKKMSRNERLAITHFAVLTGLFDDLFDRKALNNQDIIDLLNVKENHLIEDKHNQFIHKIYQRGLANSPQANLSKKIAWQVYEAQVSARRQKSAQTSIRDLQSIYQEKGRFSMLFYRSALQKSEDKQDNEIVGQLGVAGQLANDIFDIHKDLQEGIFTFANQSDTIKLLKADYLSEVKLVFEHLHQSSFAARNKKHFATVCSLILSRAWVALGQLENIEIKTGKKFRPAHNTRADLICDMEKPANLLKNIRYALGWLSEFEKQASKSR